jgi:hypothetical protein
MLLIQGEIEIESTTTHLLFETGRGSEFRSDLIANR